MNEIQKLKDQRAQQILEMETLQSELAPYEEAFENYDLMQSLEDKVRHELSRKK